MDTRQVVETRQLGLGRGLELDGREGWEFDLGSALSASEQVHNLGQRELPVSINFLVPVELNGAAVWTGVAVSHPQVLKDRVLLFLCMSSSWVACVPHGSPVYETLLSPCLFLEPAGPVLFRETSPHTV
jgi:hypothetical protein